VELLPVEADAIHRLLEIDPRTGRFSRNYCKLATRSCRPKNAPGIAKAVAPMSTVGTGLGLWIRTQLTNSLLQELYPGIRVATVEVSTELLDPCEQARPEVEGRTTRSTK